MRTIKVGDAVLPVMYAGTSPFADRVKTQIYYGNLGLVQIAEILDGNTGIEYTDSETEETETFTGYSRLTEIGFVDQETIVAFLMKEGDDGTV